MSAAAGRAAKLQFAATATVATYKNGYAAPKTYAYNGMNLPQ
jgi:hypothetical protein